MAKGKVSLPYNFNVSGILTLDYSSEDEAEYKKTMDSNIEDFLAVNMKFHIEGVKKAITSITLTKDMHGSVKIKDN